MISFVNDAKNDLSPKAEFYIFGNKFDMVPGEDKSKEDLKRTIQEEIKEYILKKDQLETDLDVIITSLDKDHRKECFKILMQIISESMSPVP